jgi:predicted lipid-binding transport protein (Tim44 family)
MSDTQQPPAPTPAAQQDIWANRFSLVVSAVGYGVVMGAVVLYLFQTQDTQIGLLIIGALIGILSQKESWFTRGRVESPNQPRTGTGNGGASVAVQNAETVNATTPAVRVPQGPMTTTTGGGTTLRPPEPPGRG